jgi:hypothetical protein
VKNMNNFDRLWNWKKYPASVFVTAIPLAAVGLGSLALLAFVKLSQGDPWYLVIFFAIGGLGFAAIRRIAKSYRIFMQSMNRNGTE